MSQVQRVAPQSIHPSPRAGSPWDSLVLCGRMRKAVENHLGSLSGWWQGRGVPGPAPETLVSISPETRVEVDSFKLASLHTESCLSVVYQVTMSWFARQHLMLELELRLPGVLSTTSISQ